MGKEICIQQKTGSCLGCPVLELALEKASVTRDNNVQAQIVEAVGQKLCPTGADIFIPPTVKAGDGRLLLQLKR